MYYNPATKELISLDELKCLLNASIPENTEEIEGWRLVHESTPSVPFGCTAVPDKIAVQNGIYVQTYKIVNSTPVDSSNAVISSSMEERIAALEEGLMEVARIMAEGRM